MICRLEKVIGDEHLQASPVYVDDISVDKCRKIIHFCMHTFLLIFLKF